MERTEKRYNCPAWMNFLNTVTGKNIEAIIQLQEFAGSCLAPERVWGTALVLQGDGLGKTTFTRILREMVGRENTSSVSMRDLECQFQRAELRDKWLNISVLESPSALDDPYFKGVVTGDPMSANVKYGDMIEFFPSCKLVYETNHSRINNRRCLSIDFNDSPTAPTQTDLSHGLMEEIDAIRAWARDGLGMLIDQGCFFQGSRVD